MGNENFIVNERQGEDRWEKRFILVQPATGEIIDDAQGYGYKTRKSAEKAGWYKFKGGKAKGDSLKRAAENFWKTNKVFAKAVNDYYECNFLEIARGENDPNADVAELAVEMNVVGFETKFLEYLK